MTGTGLSLGNHTSFFFDRNLKTSPGFPIYGNNNQLWAYKWKNWKMHFVRYQDSWNVAQSVRPDNTAPGIYNLLIDPKEEHSMSLDYWWVGSVIEKKMKQFNATLHQ